MDRVGRILKGLTNSVAEDIVQYRQDLSAAVELTLYFCVDVGAMKMERLFADFARLGSKCKYISFQDKLKEVRECLAVNRKDAESYYSLYTRRKSRIRTLQVCNICMIPESMIF